MTTQASGISCRENGDPYPHTVWVRLSSLGKAAKPGIASHLSLPSFEVRQRYCCDQQRAISRERCRVPRQIAPMRRLQ
jgi:hypothetical protein